MRQKLGIAMLPRAAVSPAPAGTVLRSLNDLVIALPVGLATRPRSDARAFRRRPPWPLLVAGTAAFALARQVDPIPDPYEPRPGLPVGLRGS